MRKKKTPDARSRSPLRLLAALCALASVTAQSATVSARPAPRAHAKSAQGVVDHWVGGRALEGVSVGVSVVCADTGEVLAAHDAERLKYTASVAKLLTTAAALRRLPAESSWPTSVYGVADERGVVSGDLTLVGRGDPQLMPDEIEALADQLAAAKITRVLGDLVVDTSRFAGPLRPPGFDTKQTDAAYRANISAAGSNYGAFVVALRPGRALGDAPRVTLSPASDALVSRDTAKTVAGADSSALTVAARALPDGRTEVAIGGEIGIDAKRIAVRKRLADPGLATGYLLRASLKKRQIALVGGVRVVTEPRAAPRGPRLAQVDSASVADTVSDMNTWSNNAMAETLFKQLGAGPEGEPATWQRAQRVVTEVIEGVGVAPAELEIVNGSGLYLHTRISPRGLTRVLLAFAGSDARSRIFRDSLPVAGETGTLKWRLRHRRTRGRVRAKTGTLDEVVSLAGYAPTRSGCPLAFAVLINDARPARTRALRRAVDRLIVSLAAL